MHTKKTTRFIYFSASIIYTFFFTIFSFIVIAVISYFFGFNLLRSPITGNDALNTLTYASWINQYFPNLPLWYPLSGGGSSFLIGYPSFYALSVVVLHKITDLGLVGSMGIINFASLVIPAWGVFLFVLIRFKMRIGALFSGVFYLISPISFVLISGAGFLSNAYAAVYAVPFILFFEWYLYLSINKGSYSKKISTLTLAGFFFVLTTLSHPVVTLGFMMLLGFYALAYGLLKDGLTGLRRAFISVLIASGVFYLLCFFWFKPFQDYTSFSNRDISFIANPATLPPVKFIGMLGLIGPQTGYPFPNFSIVPLVWIFAFIGSLLALMLRKYRIFLFGILTLISIYLAGTHGIWILITKINWFIGSFFVDRYYYTSTTILTPLVGGVGVWIVCSMPFYWVFKKLEEMHFLVRLPTKLLLSTIIAIFAFGITFWGFFFLNKFNGYYDQNSKQNFHYGEESGVSLDSLWNRTNIVYGIPDYCSPNTKGYSKILCENPSVTNNLDVNTFIYYCDIYVKSDPENRPYYCKGGKTISTTESRPLNEADMQEFAQRCLKKDYKSPYFGDLCLAFAKTPKEQLLNWPAPRLSNMEISQMSTASFSRTENPFHFLSLQNTRLDITPSLGSWTKEWGINNRSSIINAYTGQLVLNKSFNSYFMDTMYTNGAEQSPKAVDEVAHYFGISGIINTGKDQTAKFVQQNWKRTVLKEGGIFWQPPFRSSIYSIEQKPLVLIIGSRKNQAFKQIFQLGTLGAIPYNRGIMVEGKEFIDDYSFQDLSQYSLVILSGYQYKNRNNAFSLLEKFIAEGGSVFIDNGWQFTSSDWGNLQGSPVHFSDFMPISQATWGNIGNSWNAVSLDSNFGDPTSLNRFNLLTWGNDPWSLSVSNRIDLKKWAKPILSSGDKVIMAGGNYGAGKIVWSGMNFPSHALGPVNEDEITFFEKIINYLLPNTKTNAVIDLSYKRSPDELTVTVPDNSWSNNAFYFRESYYPYWKAYILKSDGSEVSMPILLAGPRFMLVKLPDLTNGDKIIFKFDSQLHIFIPLTISFVSWFILILLLFDAYLLNGKILKVFNRFLSSGYSFVAKPSKKIRFNLGNEDDY